MAPFANFIVTTYSLSRFFLILFGVSTGLFIYLYQLYRPYNIDSRHNALSEGRVKGPFIKLYFILFLATFAGLMMIGRSHTHSLYYFEGARFNLSLLVSIFAFFNGIARPIFGRLMDQLGYQKTVFISALILGLSAVGALFNQGQSIVIYSITYSAFWLILGAHLAIAPQAIKEYYPISQYSKRYGLLFTAYGFAALLSTILSRILLRTFEGVSILYYILFGIALLIIILLYTLQGDLKKAKTRKKVLSRL